MITQLQNYKDQICKRVEAILSEESPIDKADSEKLKPPKINQVRRYDVFPVKRLTSREDVDTYLDTIRKKLYDALQDNDGIQII